MTAVRWLARAAGCLVLLFAFVAWVLWVYAGPRGAWTLAGLVSMAVIIIGAGLGLSALWPRPADPCGCPCGCPGGGHRDDDGTPGWCDPCRMSIHQEA